MKKRMLCVLGGLLAASITFGCQAEPAADGESAGGGSASEESADGESDAGGDGVTLQLLQFKEDQAAIVKAMVEDFNSQSDGITVEATILGDDFSATRQARFAGGEGPDLFFVEGYSDAQTWLEYLTDLSDEEWVEDLAANTVDGVTFDGKIYGFPIGLEGYGFVYNKDLFEQAGITELPRTLTELKEVDEKLKENGIQASCDAMAEWWFTGQHLLSIPFGTIEDPQGFAEAVTAGEKTIADNPYMDGFFDIMDYMTGYGEGADSVGMDYNASIAKFAAGETAMMMTGNWAEVSITTANPDINVGIFAVPMSDDAADARIATNVSAYYAVNNQSEYVEEAKEFLNWMHDHYQEYFVDQLNLIPAFTEGIATDNLGMIAGEISGYVNEGKTSPFAFFFWPTGANQEFHAPLQQYAAGVLDRDGTLEEMQSIWDKYAK